MRLRSQLATCLFVTSFIIAPAFAQDETPASDQPEAAPEAQPEAAPDPGRDKFDAGTFSPLRARSIGPALMSGRIGDIAVNPGNHGEYYVAAASGGVWKTTNGGVTFDPIFDGEGSYSIGCVTIDPNDDNIVWVGTGENNSQRSVAFGDGVYKSTDAGRSWKNVGLPESGHIGMIAVDPRDSNVVYVAALGPLWRAGGDRGLYQTTDGGKTWNRILHVSEDTGINEVHIDPSNPDRLYASAYQRRRQQWTLVDGGPEGAIYRSEDAGKTWDKINSGLPGGDIGRVGLAISPADPTVVYAVVTASGDSSGFFRTTNRGESWQRMSGYKTSSPQYYNEIFADPNHPDRVYLVDTFMQVTNDAGRTWDSVPSRRKHVDSHALWIDPEDSNHMINGNDGGLYETFDGGNSWRYAPNLPITQFYRVAVDNDWPFYNVYGGTQDNNTLGGPSQTFERTGIANEDWFVTVGGDGFEPAVDPEDPNIVYSQWQYGGLVRFDRRSGQNVDIRPMEKPDDPPFVWNWDSPLIISPHDNHRLYFGGRYLFRSDDQGNSWNRISDDLSRAIDRNTLEIMGKVQPPEAVDKDLYTSIYGTSVAISESPLVEDLIYVGTDDGLVHVSADAGATWRKIGVFPGVPHKTYVSDLEASRHHPDRVYATFDNHKAGDFKPYVLISNDRGETWEDISGDLGEREVAYSIAEDTELEGLLFLGTEFGAWWTLTGGDSWHKVRGLPTIAVRDVEIQRRENDLVMATFGRSFYIVDDYTPLRTATQQDLDRDAYIFPVKDAYLYIPRSRGTGSQGSTFYSADNADFGAVITYNIKSVPKGLGAERRDKARGDDEYYPTLDELRAEDEEQPRYMRMVIRDAEGAVVTRMNIGFSEGMSRAAWNLRYEGDGPISGGFGHYAAPGTYTAEIVQVVDGVSSPLGEPREFEVVALDIGTFEPDDQAEVLAFRRSVNKLSGAIQAGGRVLGEAQERLDAIKSAIVAAEDADQAMLEEVHALQVRLNDLRRALYGDHSADSRMYPSPPSINSRIGAVRGDQWGVTSPPTQTHRDQYRYAGEAFTVFLDELRPIVQTDLPSLEQRLDEAGAPWTPTRFPEWDGDAGDS